MKIAITGGTGFVGGHLARALVRAGHRVVLISRGFDLRDQAIRCLPNSTFVPIGLDDEAKLTAAFAGCDGVAHCAGINREIGNQTYERVHVQGTRNVANAARRAGVKKLALTSFLRARPNCGSGYHESKWAAEEIIRASGLDFTILKAGVIWGKGDHMLHHLSQAFHTFPVFALVGFTDQYIRPAAVADVVRLLQGAFVEGWLARQTVAVLGPEQMTLSAAVRRVARVLGKQPLMFRLPVLFHYGLAWFTEKVMVTPLVSLAQVRILSEGVVEPLPPCDLLPDTLRPQLPFAEEPIRQGLPEPRPLGWADLRWFAPAGGNV